MLKNVCRLLHQCLYFWSYQNPQFVVTSARAWVLVFLQISKPQHVASEKLK